MNGRPAWNSTRATAPILRERCSDPEEYVPEKKPKRGVRRNI